MPNAYQQSILNLRYAPLKRTAETEERILTALETAADQLKRLIGNSDSPLSKKYYNQRRLQVAALMKQVSIGLKKDISDQVQAIADEVAAIMQEETNDLLVENLRPDVVADFTQVPREVLNWAADRQDREGLKLSANIWADNQINQIETVLLAGVARGESARDLSLKLEQFVLGGGQGMGDSIRSKAMRLARTEINNSYWEARRMSSELSPVVQGIKWELSARHPEWDVCDYLSKQDLYGLGPGVYPPELLPPKPHPNCLCYSIDVLRDVGAWDEPRDVPELGVNPFDVPDGKKPNGFSENYIKRQHQLFVDSIRVTEEAYRGTTIRRGGIRPQGRLVEAPPSTFDEAVRRRISQGVDTHRDFIEVGNIIRREIEASYRENLGPPLSPDAPFVREAADDFFRTKRGLSFASNERFQHGVYLKAKEWAAENLARIERIDKETGLKVRQALDKAAGEGGLLHMRLGYEIQDALNELKWRPEYTSKKAEGYQFGDVVVEALQKVRSMGNTGQTHRYKGRGGRQEFKKMFEEETQKYFPTDWLQWSADDSKQNALSFKKVGRGYYSPGYGSREPYIAIDDYSPQSTMIHEFGHRCEYMSSDIYPKNHKMLADLEREFYDERTAGEQPRWLGRGYRRDEVYRPDKFIEKYMGKDYSSVGIRQAMEVLTMGLEGVLYNHYPLLEEDPEYFDFILGLLAAYE
jgi:hypothetical protein